MRGMIYEQSFRLYRVNTHTHTHTHTADTADRVRYLDDRVVGKNKTRKHKN